MTPLERAVIEAARKYYWRNDKSVDYHNYLMAAVEALEKAPIRKPTINDLYQEILNIRTTNGMGTRTYNIIKNMGVSLERIQKTTAVDLLEIKNFGMRSLAVLSIGMERLNLPVEAWAEEIKLYDGHHTFFVHRDIMRKQI